MRRIAFAALVAGVIAFTPAAAHAAFPGANGKIAFFSRPTLNYHVYTIDPDGSGTTQLTAMEDEESPAWSPDGRKLVFQHWYYNDDACISPPEFYCSELWTMNSDGTGQTNISPARGGPGGDLTPAWSPDGKKIVFEHTIQAVHDRIWTTNPDGSGRVALTSGPFIDSRPAWSPTGDRIVLTRFDYDQPQTGRKLWTIDADGGNASQVTQGDRTISDANPDWSPNASMIAFERFSQGNSDIYAVKPNGTGLVNLTNNPASDERPAWSPDGTKIAFTSNRDGNHEIYVMDADSSDQTRVTTTPHDEFAPDWQPLGAFDPYPRPGGATPLRVPLVPAYAQCTDPAFQHVGPLDEPSCGPPIQESSLLTTSTTGKGLGSARLDVQVGDPLTAEDEADVAIKVSATDVRNASGPIDYTGQVIFTTALQMTDRANGFGEVSGTTGLFGFSAPVDCTPSPDPSAGSSCTLNTTADSLVAGTAKEGKRAVVATRLIRILDLGADGQLNPNCPPTCGTGDEKAFLGAGVFAP